MKFSDSEYTKKIGKLRMTDIAEWIYNDGYRQTSSRYAILTHKDNPLDILTECGPALVKAVRKLERKEVTDANRIQTDQNP